MDEGRFDLEPLGHCFKLYATKFTVYCSKLKSAVFIFIIYLHRTCESNDSLTGKEDSRES